MPGFTVERTIDAPVDDVWAELADFGEIRKWNPGVTESYLTSEETEGEGISRHCSLKPFGSVEERVTGWHPGERLVVHIYQIDKLPQGIGASIAERHGGVAVSALEATGLRELLESVEKLVFQEGGSEFELRRLSGLAAEGVRSG